MISYSQAQRLAANAGVPPEIIEKDYLIELLLFYLSRDEYLNQILIFRGGTSLKKIYFPDYRFSEDMDFLVPNQNSLKETELKLETLLNRISADYPSRLTQKPEINSEHFQSFISYDIIPEIKATKQLKVDIWKDDNIPGWQSKQVLFTHQDFKEEIGRFKTYNLESVISDKINRVLDVDKEARDIYDLWYLLKLCLDIPLVHRELKNKFGYNPYLPDLLDKIKAREFRVNWQIRLTHQIANLPDYDIVLNELTELINSKLLNP